MADLLKNLKPKYVFQLLNSEVFKVKKHRLFYFKINSFTDYILIILILHGLFFLQCT